MLQEEEANPKLQMGLEDTLGARHSAKEVEGGVRSLLLWQAFRCDVANETDHWRARLTDDRADD